MPVSAAPGDQRGQGGGEPPLGEGLWFGSGGPFEIDGGKKLDVPSLREGHALKHTDEEFAGQIANGGDGMPAFKNRLDPERVGGLVRFIRREFQGKTAAAADKPLPAPAH